MKHYKITKRVITLNIDKRQFTDYHDTLRKIRHKIARRKDRQLTPKEKQKLVLYTIAWKRNYQDSFDAELRWF